MPLIAIAAILGLLASAGAAVAASGSFRVEGGADSGAVLNCPGGMSRLGHVLNEDANIFEGDPETVITYLPFPEFGFQIEEVRISTHTSTHLDVPSHFFRGRSIDQLDATEFVWPAYVIDVRDRMTTEPVFQLSVQDIRDYEDDNGRIEPGSLVIIQTGFENFFGTPAYEDPVPGFSGDAVQWMFDNRSIGAIGSDTFGPDATGDDFFSATDTALLNDGVALPGMTNLDSVNTKGDIIIASAVALENGSGYQVDPLACHGIPDDDGGDDDDEGDDDD